MSEEIIVRYVEGDAIDLIVNDDGDMLDMRTSIEKPIEIVTDYPGPAGLNGWIPALALVEDGERTVVQVIDWFGGTGQKPDAPRYVSAGGLTTILANATDVRGDEGQMGPQGSGWSPLYAMVADGERRILQVSDWTGGSGAKPATGAYLGAAGHTAEISEATDFRGAPGAKGDTGDVTPEAQAILDAATTTNTDTIAQASGYLDSVSAVALTVAGDKTAAQGAAAGAAAVSGLSNLSEAARAIVLASDVAAVFPYFTDRDSDGGAWRHKVAHTSWMNETLGTATRGTRAEFPSKALIVAQSASITIYDADDPACPMWAVWSRADAPYGVGWWEGASISSISARNGVVAFGTTGTVTEAGLCTIDFISDQLARYTNNNSYGGKGLPASSGAKAEGLPVRLTATETIVHYNVSSIAITVLPHTPLNPLRCDLPNPVVGVAHGVGVSVIKPDGAVSNGTQGGAYNEVRFADNGLLMSTRSGINTYVTEPRAYLGPSTFTLVSLAAYDGASAIKTYGGLQQGAIWMRGSNIALRNTSGLNVFSQNDHDPVNSLIAYVTDKFNSGYLHGATKLALAESSADLSSLTGIAYGPELITRGSFDKISGATAYGTGTKLSITADGRLRATFDGTSGTKGATLNAATEIGKTYKVTFDLKTMSGVSWLNLNVTVPQQIVQHSIAGVADGHSIQFTATTTTADLNFLTGNPAANSYIELDNVSCKEVIGELVNNGKLDQGTTGWANWFGHETVAVNAGALRVTVGAGQTIGGAKQTLPNVFVTGQYYLIKFRIVANPANRAAWVGWSGIGGFPAQAVGEYTVLRKAGSVGYRDFHFGLQTAAAGDYIEFDDISIKPLAGIDKPELVTNGHFTTDTAGWTLTNANGTFVSESGRAKITNVGGRVTAYQAIAVTPNKVYELTCQVTANVGTVAAVRVGTSAGINDVLFGTTSRAFFIPTTSTVYVAVYNGDASAGTESFIDNISVKEADAGLGANLVTNGGFADATGWTLGTSFTVSGGTLNSTGTVGNATFAGGVPAAVGRLVAVSFDIVSQTAQNAYIALGSLNYVQLPAGVGRFTIYALTTGASGDFTIRLGSGAASISLDNISVREVTDSLVVNGTFDTGVEGWTLNGTGSLAWDAGRLAVTGNTGYTFAHQVFPTVVGRTYRARATLVVAAVNNYWRLGTFPGALDYGGVNGGGVGARDTTFVATTTTVYLQVGTFSGAQTSIWDDITLEEIPTELVTNGDFSASGTSENTLEGWATTTTGNGTVAVANGVATLTGGTGTAQITQTLTGLTVGVPTRLKFTVSTGPIDMAVAGLAEAAYAIGAQEVSFTPTATSHVLTFSVDAGETAGVTGISVVQTTGTGTGLVFDRSVAANHPTVYGTLSRTAVASGADIAAFGGFSADNRLSGNVTTGGFWMGWQEDTAGQWSFKTGANLDGCSEVAGAFTIQGTKRKALIRYSTTVPSADQLKAIEAAERHLFQPNAKALLLGSPNVQALAFDNDNDKLYAATAVGTNVFRGLQRVGYRQSTTGRNKANGSFLGIEVGSSLLASVGVTGTVVGKGVEDGLPYIEVRFQGTRGSGTSIFEFPHATPPTAAAGETWTASYYGKLISAPSSIQGWGAQASMGVTLWGANSGGGQTEAASDVSIYASLNQDAPTRQQVSLLLASASSVRTRMFYTMRSDVGVVVDYTMRIYGPQLEKSATATAYSDPLSASDNHKVVAALDGNFIIGTAAGVDVFLPAIPMRERLTGRKPFAPYDPRTGTHRAVTTDATPTDVLHIPVAEGKAFRFRAMVAAAQYGGTATERAAYVVEGIAWRDVGGNVQVSATTTVLNEVTASQDCVAVANTSPQTLSIRATGKAATPMAWVTRMEMDDLGLMGAA